MSILKNRTYFFNAHFALISSHLDANHYYYFIKHFLKMMFNPSQSSLPSSIIHNLNVLFSKLINEISLVSNLFSSIFSDTIFL